MRENFAYAQPELYYHQPLLIPRLPAKYSNDNTPASAIHTKESKPTADSPLSQYITYFDRNWQKEGLPRDWHNLHGAKSEVGFSMKLQLDLIKDPSDREDLSTWTQKTKRDLIGFKLEYLSDHVIYPCKYSIDPGSKRMESLEYGKKDITETVSDNERRGSVKQSLKEMKEFFLSPQTPDGSIAIMTSPMGDSGLTTDSGQKILYPDSYFFIMQKNGDTVTNYTLKTDFTLQQSRDAIFALSGKKLDQQAPIESYVRTVAKILPGGKKNINNLSDVVRILEKTKPQHAYQNPASRETAGWKDVYSDIEKGEELYRFNQQTTKIINDFESHCRQENLTKEDLQKAMAATILLMSRLFYNEQSQREQTQVMQPGTWVSPKLVDTNSFGSILNAVSQRPGCAGGGSTSITSVTERLGVSGSDNYGSREFNCPTCHSTNIRPINQLLSKCQHCGSNAVAC